MIGFNSCEVKKSGRRFWHILGLLMFINVCYRLLWFVLTPCYGLACPCQSHMSAFRDLLGSKRCSNSSPACPSHCTGLLADHRLSCLGGCSVSHDVFHFFIRFKNNFRILQDISVFFSCVGSVVGCLWIFG